jgi:hypothetical protein
MKTYVYSIKIEAGDVEDGFSEAKPSQKFFDWASLV